ncbi:hypothetical protein G4B88_003035 [Cannabis sativa]|uniref:F-box domain-containing protein n=1 Tax=Cannabis sativa TaxID=3483 RepID=A0A7J6E430_CANSA|nr:hypothetical protein G4B88_003035 [Cannabis sativa]
MTKLSWDSVGNDSIISLAFDPSQNPTHISIEFKLEKKKRSASHSKYTLQEQKNVLYLLPTNTLFQLKCVSKSWNNLISDRSLIQSQLQRTKLSISKLIFQDKFSWLNKDIKIVTYIPVDEEGFQFKQTIFDFYTEDVVPSSSTRMHVTVLISSLSHGNLSWKMNLEKYISIVKYFSSSSLLSNASTVTNLNFVEMCMGFLDGPKAKDIMLSFPNKFPWLNKDIKIVTYILDDEEGFQFKQTIFDFHPKDVVVSSSCQGLIFCSSCFPTQDLTIYICNPLNKGKTKLSWDSLGNDSIISFAFDPSQNLIHISTKFKLVKVEAIDIGEEEEKEVTSTTNDTITRWKHQNILREKIKDCLFELKAFFINRNACDSFDIFVEPWELILEDES